MSAPDVLAVGTWRNNAALIADVARLGYLDGTVLDATHGEGTFWRDWQPAQLTTNDLHKPADLNADYRYLPFPARSFDAVVFDPPYKLSGTPALGTFDHRYGIEHPTSCADRLDDITAGAVECYRVARRHLLVKVQDQVAGGQVRWQTDLVTRAVEAHGGVKVDRFDLPSTPRPQPGGRPQRTARRNASQLLVFKVGR